MLEPLDLDGSSYGMLYADALAQTRAFAPHWDARPSDPGVALLELFAFLTDVQNHAINTVTDEHLVRYLRLLGMEHAAMAPACVLVSPRFEGEYLRLPEGARFAAGQLLFETEQAVCFKKNRLQLFWIDANGEETVFSPGNALFARQEEQLVLALDAPAEEGEREFWFRLEPCGGRCPPEAGMEPMVRIAAEVWNGSGWLPAELEDETCGLLRSGLLRILAPRNWKRARLRVVRGRFDFPPVLAEVVLHPLRLRQTHTYACISQSGHLFAEQKSVIAFLREKDGWREVSREEAEREPEPERMRLVCTEPGFAARRALTGIVSETVSLDIENLLPQSLHLMQKEGALWYDCPVAEPGLHTLPRGCKYDRETGSLRFGDGRDFAIPPPGELLFCGLQTTEGADGNAAAGTIRSLDLELYQPEPATGGRREEPLEEALRKAAITLGEKKRAVTLADYEGLALRVPGLVIEKARALPLGRLVQGAYGVALLLKPGAVRLRPELGEYEKKRVLDFLEPYRMLTSRLCVFGARYLAIHARLRVTLYREEAGWEKKLRAVMLDYTDGTEGRLSFGETVSRPALFRQLEKQSFILRVEELTLLPGGTQGKLLPDGSIQPGPDVLPYLEKLSLFHSPPAPNS